MTLVEANGANGHSFRRVRVHNAKGVHARPSAKIVKLVEGYDAEVWIQRGDTRANAGSILDVMMLAACEGCELELSAEGPEAPQALAAVAELFEGRFGE